MDPPRTINTPTLPLEICAMIIHSCHTSPTSFPLYTTHKYLTRLQTLSNCSLTNRFWHYTAQPLLFHTIFATTSPQSYRSVNKLSMIVRERPDLGRLVKTLVIDGSRGDPSWVPVMLHGKWFPNLVVIGIMSKDSGGQYVPRSFYKFLTVYSTGSGSRSHSTSNQNQNQRPKVRQLHLEHVDTKRKCKDVLLLNALTPFTDLTHLEVKYKTLPNPTSYYPPNPTAHGINLLKSLVVSVTYTAYTGDTIDSHIVPILEKGMISLKNLECFYADGFDVMRSVRGVVGRCYALRELYLVENLRHSSKLERLPPDISLSSLYNIRRIHCTDVPLHDIIQMLTTLPSPSPLTQLDIDIWNLSRIQSAHTHTHQTHPSIEQDNPNASPPNSNATLNPNASPPHPALLSTLSTHPYPWNHLDNTLTSPSFPSFIRLRISILDVPKRTFMQEAEKNGWLRACLSRGVVEYGPGGREGVIQVYVPSRSFNVNIQIFSCWWLIDGVHSSISFFMFAFI
ncbi:hypothetical protein K474DRAFT_980043 [Panus rudis PR-1116 ss-1]|nr:hypothetical protein K474DRAFT_980043 [Panus rudis PR-1116 ss-1]